MFLASPFDKTIDKVFFISIICGILFVVIWFISAKVVLYIKDKNYKKEKELKEARINKSNEELEKYNSKEEISNEDAKEDIDNKEDIIITDDNIESNDLVSEEENENVDSIVLDNEEVLEKEDKAEEVVEDISDEANEDTLEVNNVTAVLFDEDNENKALEDEAVDNNISTDELENSSSIDSKETEVTEEVSTEEENVEELNTIEDNNSFEEENVEALEEAKEEKEEIVEELNTIEDNNSYEEDINSNEENIKDLKSLDDVEEFPLEDEVSEEDLRPEAKPKKLKGVIPVKKGRTYNGKYEVFQVADGYSYRLKASNGEVLVQSETFTSHDGVLKAIDAVKRNLETGDIKVFEDKNGKFKFKLVSKNYRVIAISANYSVEKSAFRAVESFKKFALKADIVDIDVDDKESLTATPIELKDNIDKEGAKFLYMKYNGIFSWELRAPNGEILCQSDGYTTKNGVLYSIDTFKRNLGNGTFKCVTGKDGGYSFRLYNQQGRVCAIGESYSSKQSAESAANSVINYYKNAVIVEFKEKNNK